MSLEDRLATIEARLAALEAKDKSRAAIAPVEVLAPWKATFNDYLTEISTECASFEEQGKVFPFVRFWGWLYEAVGNNLQRTALTDEQKINLLTRVRDATCGILTEQKGREGSRYSRLLEKLPALTDEDISAVRASAVEAVGNFLPYATFEVPDMQTPVQGLLKRLDALHWWQGYDKYLMADTKTRANELLGKTYTHNGIDTPPDKIAPVDLMVARLLTFALESFPKAPYMTRALTELSHMAPRC